ncbi:MAG: sugar nucleotide-binding protein [Candidatus Eisenbacteria bacterium]|uniref:dTDP-4-dehydrorhamnose reductase n=1 Tax=Eiseniibacteriota bacterium TaxID=2212470 RepID=A0A538U8H9_UNCEI|nr:MAG: sugar nucleotide-binding protein [Candidatus Eisenbacteria bacterium]
MSTSRVLVLGGTGMLGAMVADVLSRDPKVTLTVTARRERVGLAGPARAARCLPLDAESDQDGLPSLLAEGFDWIVNAIGVIKPYIKDTDPAQTERAVRVNGLFPHRLARAAGAAGLPVLQIATDCVYSGKAGRYGEDAPHDALDVYGKSKSLGEVPAPAMHHLRCSIIGPELAGHLSLLDWFRGQAPGAQLTGYANHLWNGVTTYHYARLCQGVIHSGRRPAARQHVVPTGMVTKAEMLETFATVYGRKDLTIRRGEAAVVIDRTLSTQDEAANRALWSAAGYATPPSFGQMMTELAAHPFNQ